MNGPTSSTPPQRGIGTAIALAMVDTSVLVQAAVRDSGAKHRQANALLDRLCAEDALAVSAQVLHEFYAAVTRPHGSRSTAHVQATQIIAALVEAATVLPVTAAATVRALDAMTWHGLSYGDALVWATAKEGGVAVVHSENFQDGRTVEGVRFANPFA